MPATRALVRECVAPSTAGILSSDEVGTGSARSDELRRERLARLRELIVERFGPHVLLDWQRPSSASPPSGSIRECVLPADPRVLPTGILGLDLALGGGLPRGRLIELAGPPYSGKRTLAGWFVRTVQRRRGWVAYLDAAHGADFDRWHRWGVDVLDLLVALPRSLDEALELGRLLVLAQALDLVVLDLPPHLALRPELARGLRRLRPLLRGTPAAFVVVRDRTQEPALAAAQVRLRLEPLVQLALPGPLAIGNLPDGLRIRLLVERSPRWPPRDPLVPIELSLHEGVRASLELVDLGLASGIVVRHSLGLVFAGTVLGRTRELAARYLESEPELRSRLEEEICAHWVSGDRSSAELFAR